MTCQPFATASACIADVSRDFRDLLCVLRLGIASDPGAAQRLDEIIYLPAGPVGATKHEPRKLRKLVLFIACCSISRMAVAQEAEVLTPIELFEEEAGSGVRVGPELVLYGKAETQIVHDTNIYNDEAIKRSDQIAVLRPTLHLKTDLPRHFAEIIAGAQVRRHFDIGDEDSEQFEVVGRSFLDLGDRISFKTEAILAERIELRGTAGDAFSTDRPIQYFEKGVSAEFARTGGTLELIGGGSLKRLTYDDATIGGNPIDLSFRDASVRKLKLRANYRVSENVRLFTQAEGNEVDYDFDGTVSRDSNGYAIFGGIQYQPSQLVDLQAAAGFINQDFDDPTVKSASGLNYLVEASWTPTPKWKLTASGERAVDPSPLSNVPAIIRSDFELKAQRVLGDRLLVETRVAYVNEDYRSVTRTDKRYIAEAGVRVRVTDRVGASAFAGYRKQDSNNPGEGYSGASFGLSVSVLL